MAEDVGLEALQEVYHRARSLYRMRHDEIEPLFTIMLEAEKAFMDALRTRGLLWTLETHWYGSSDTETEEYRTREEAEAFAEALDSGDNGYPVRLTGPDGFVKEYR